MLSPSVKCLALVSLLSQVPCADSWRTWGVLPDIGLFTEYVGKFCFDFKEVPNGQAKPKIGTIELSVQGKLEPTAAASSLQVTSSEGSPCWGPCDSRGHLYLIVFDDEKVHGQIAKREWGQMSCEEMLHRATFALRIDLTTSSHFEKTVDVHESVRPRFWYFTFAACGVKMVTPPAFSIHAKNTRQGYQSEFGIDEQGSLMLQHFAALAFFGLGALLHHVAKRATGAEALRSRPLLRTLLFSTALSAAAAACFSLHLSVYAVNGGGVAWLEVLGTACLVLSKATLSALQLLLAKGWALFYSPQEVLQRQIMVCFFGIILLVSLGCEIHAAYYHDWSTDIYIYESWPGMIILSLNVLLFMEAWRSMRDTYRLETSEEVRLFYAYVSGASLLYFLSQPVTCILASQLMPWWRAKIVDRVEVICRLLATAILGYVLRPSRLDAMVNARMEEGLETLGEPQEEVHIAGEINPAAGSVPLMKMKNDPPGYRDEEDVSEDLAEAAGLPAE